MNKEEFLTKFEDILQYESDEKLSFNTKLAELDEWDSISIISTVAFLDKEFGKKCTVDEIKNMQIIKELANLAGIDE